ncbi:TPA: restriction endonuclease subunit S [Haemophilus influenzae]
MKNNRTFLEKLLDGSEVEWKPLKKVCNFISTGKLNANAMDENGIYPFFTCNEKPYKINNYAFDMEAILISGNGSQVGHLNYFKGKFNAYQRTYVIGEFDNNTLVMYLYHYLNFKLRDYITINSKKGSVPYITLPMLEKFEIPIPPLSVQTEIVKILDALTALTSELTSELILRQKQYEYYREKLLSFDSLEQLNSGGGKKKLIDVAKIKNGKDWKHLGEGNIPIYGSGGIMGYVDTYSYDRPTVLIPRKGTITNIFYLEEPFWNVDTIYYTEIDTTQIVPKYFYHFMKTVDLTKLDTGSGRPSLTQAILNEIPIFVPSIEEQHRIVSILDKFETLTNSITEGLPLAIEQSQKRYEYYRELLLNFKQ